MRYPKQKGSRERRESDLPRICRACTRIVDRQSAVGRLLDYMKLNTTATAYSCISSRRYFASIRAKAGARDHGRFFSACLKYSTATTR
jgi:hypothetical protein